MSGESNDASVAYVEAAAEFAQMPLSAERRLAVAVVMTRIAGFAAHLRDVALTDDVEIAGVFTP